MRPLLVKILEDHYLNLIITLDVLGFLRLVAPYLLSGLPDKRDLEITPLSGTFWGTDSTEYRADGVISIRRRKDRDDFGLPLLHVEVEHAWSARLGERLEPCRRAMEEYHQQEVLTVAIVLRGDRSGFVVEEAPFKWLRFALPGCGAKEYLARAEPVAWALAARMDPGEWSPLRHKLECYRRLDAAPDLDDHLREFLERWFEVAVPLPGEEEDELDRLLESESGYRTRHFAF